LAQTFEQFGDHLKETLTAGPAVAKKEESDMDLTIFRKALGLADAATEDEVVKSMTELFDKAKKMPGEKKDRNPDSKKESDYDEEEEDEDPELKGEKKAEREEGKEVKDEDKKDGRGGGKSREPGEKQGKRYDLPVDVQKALAEGEALKKRLEAIENERDLLVLEKRCTDAGIGKSEAVTLQKAYKGDKAAFDKLFNIAKQAVAAANASGVFKEFGSSTGAGVSDEPIEQLNELAKQYQKKNPGTDFSKAFAKVYEDPANAEIVKRERQANRPSAA
jgi:hypothetical protein